MYCTEPKTKKWTKEELDTLLILEMSLFGIICLSTDKLTQTIKHKDTKITNSSMQVLVKKGCKMQKNPGQQSPVRTACVFFISLCMIVNFDAQQ